MRRLERTRRPSVGPRKAVSAEGRGGPNAYRDSVVVIDTALARGDAVFDGVDAAPVVGAASGLRPRRRLFGEEAVAVDDGGGEVDEFAVGGAGVVAEHLEGGGFADVVAFHEDAFGSLCGGAAPERPFEVVVFREAAQDDVDRALPVLDVGVVDVGEHAAFGSFLNELGVAGVQQHDDGAGGFVDDFVDQVQGVLAAFAESDERDVGALAGGHGTDVLNVDLARDHFVAERDHDRSDDSEPVTALVGYQNAEMIGVSLAHRRFARRQL
jgi:hypothetical protein